jgi:hypothetical protein
VKRFSSHTWSGRIPVRCIVLILVATSGCSDAQKALAPVSGVVTLDGKPLAGASVRFQPVAPAGETISGKGSYAFCGPDGRFELSTIDDKPGAVVGDHTVRIYGPKAQANSATDEGGRRPPEIVPRRYNSQTELKFTVPSDGTDQANFDLKTKG